jgi:hypothetical protein
LIEAHPGKKVKLRRPVFNKKSYTKCEYQVQTSKQKLHNQDTGEMLIEQMLVLRDIPVVEIGDTQIEQHIEKKGEIEDCKI